MVHRRTFLPYLSLFFLFFIGVQADLTAGSITSSSATISQPTGINQISATGGKKERWWQKQIRPKRPGRLSLILSLIGLAMISVGATQVLSWTAIGLIAMLLPLGLLVMFLAIVFGGIALYRHQKVPSKDRKSGITGLILGALPYVVLVSWFISLLVRGELG